MTVFAVINKTRFQGRLNACDYRFVDVAFALFASFYFNFVVEEFLSINNRQAAFFSLSGVYKHPFHRVFLCRFSFCTYQTSHVQMD